MATFSEKTEHALNYDADKKILRAEFMNAVQPALNKALAELALRHSELETKALAPKRFCSAFTEVKELAEVGLRRHLEAGSQ